MRKTDRTLFFVELVKVYGNGRQGFRNLDHDQSRNFHQTLANKGLGTSKSEYSTTERTLVGS